jgi:hypothetical protein
MVDRVHRMFPRPRRSRLEAELHGEVLRRQAQASYEAL